MLTAVKKMHDSGLVHQDLKTDNFLIYYDPRMKQLTLKISDYGLTKKENDPSKALATMWYESPEISAFYLDPSRGQSGYYHGEYNSYARDLVGSHRSCAIV